MRILLVSPFLPYPPVAGGHAQVWAWVKRLATRHQVAFVGFQERETETGQEEIARYCGPVRVRLRQPTPHAYCSFAQRPRWVTEYFSQELAADISEVTRHFRPEVALFASSNMAQYRRWTGPAASVVTALELTSLAYRRRVEAARGWERWQAWLDWVRMLRYETGVFRRAAGAIAVSEREARVVEAMAPGRPVAAIPPGVDAEQLAPRPRRPRPGRVLYLGHMEHSPNLDGLLFLYQEIWPRVVAKHPAARLVVVGTGAREELARVAPETLARMERDASVEIAGFVADLRATMEEAEVMAAPLRLGSGVRNKVVVSLAAGLPVVTTGRGAEGLEAAHERELLIGEGAEGFAEQLVRALGDGGLRARLSAAARELAARDHDNDRLAARLEEALARAAEVQR